MTEVLFSDIITSSYGEPIFLGPIKPPVDPADAATKAYVDSSVPNVAYPLEFDHITNVISIKDASITDSGVITTGTQSIAGDKTFTGSVVVPTPTDPNEAATKGYTDSHYTGTAPISVSVGGAISMPAASAVSSGYVTTGTQTMAGDKTLTGHTRSSGLYFSTSNGWISGGLITPHIGGTTFDISAVTCRFTDYSTETDPVPTSVITFPEQLNIGGEHTNTNSVSIYIQSDGSLYQDPLPINVTLMYSSYIRLGRIVYDATGHILGASNAKYPLADRYDLVPVDFILQIMPLNMDGFMVSQSAHVPPDLSVAVGTGSIWEQNINIMNERNNPSIITIPAVDQPEIIGFWKDALGDIQQSLMSPLTNIDNTQYNPNGTGGLVPIPSGYWVNIPIMYEGAASVYAFQYATTAYQTRELALPNVGNFVRYKLSVLQYYIVLGYVTVQEGATDLTNATFSSGEYFGYNIGMGSGYLSGTQATTDQSANTAWLDYQYGDDANAVITFESKPFKSYTAASAAIPGTAAYHNPYLIYGFPGEHLEASIAIKPFVNVSCTTMNASIFTVTGLGNDVTLDPSWVSIDNPSGPATTVQNIHFGSTGLNLDFYTIGGAGSKQIFFANCIIDNPVNCAASNATDLFKFLDVDFEQDITVDGGELLLAQCEMDTGSLITITATNVPQHSQITSLTIQDIVITATTGFSCGCMITNCLISGSLTVDGAFAVLNINRGSVPANIANIHVTNGGTLNVYDDLLTANEVSAINNAVVPLGPANVVVDTSTLTTLLGGKVGTATTVNGHALSANITVGFPDISGQIAHGQLCTLQSGDIPNNGADTTGTAANLTAAAALPNGTSATTQADMDNSTKLATTAYLDRLRGAVGGVATLDGTGKIPSAQIDLSSLGALSYQGTWSSNSYPTATAAGQFWIVDGTITLGPPVSGDLHTGDWLIWDGSAWGSVTNSNIVTYLTTWPGSTAIDTLGTITTGIWNGDVIGSAYGGAGAVSGIMKADGAGNVSAALHAGPSDDYVAPGDDTSLAGIKTFSNGAHSSTPLVTDNSTLVATTAYVQSAANVPQIRVKYVSAVGTDAAPNNGTTWNLAVNSFQYAASLCTAPSITVQYALVSLDAAYDPLGSITLPSFINIHAPIKFMTGTNVFSDSSHVQIKRFDTPLVGGSYPGCSVVYAGGSGTGYSFVRAQRIYQGAVWVNSNQGIRTLDVGIIDQATSATPVITCNGPNSYLYVLSTKITGLISAIGDGAVVDLSLVADLTDATFYTTPHTTAKIIYPSQGVGNVTGIVKCNGTGDFTAATVGVDYLIPSSTITVTGDVSGSGPSTGVSTAIGSGTVTLAKMAHLNANTCIANPTVLSAQGQYTPMVSTATANSVLYRDTSANTYGNHFSGGFASRVAGSVPNPKSLTITDAPTQEITGNGTQVHTIRLPVATGLTKGVSYTIINNNVASPLTNTITVHVQYQDGSSVVDLYQGQATVVVLSDPITGGGNGTWTKSTYNDPIYLTGDVLALGRGDVTTSISSHAITLGKIAQGTGPAALAYTSGSLGEVSTISYTSASTSSTLALRDTSSNITVNSIIEGYNAPGASIGLTAASAPVQYYSSGTFTVTLPDVTTGFTAGKRYTVINDGTGIITVADGASNVLAYVKTGMRISFVLTTIGSQAGSWKKTGGSVFCPIRLFTNTYAQAHDTGTLTAADLYNGPFQATSANSVTYTMPTYSVLIGNVSTATSLIGILGYMPPQGFQWSTVFIPGANKAVSISTTGVTGAVLARDSGSTYNGGNNNNVYMHFWLDTANSQYYVCPGTL